VTQLVQILLTPEQAALLGASADVTVRAHEAETLVVLTDEEKASYEQLAVFMGQVALHPEAFPVVGRMAAKLKKQARKIKGPAQPTSRKNRRKERQERRTRTSKARRIENREQAAAYNEARTIAEAELAELQEIQDERMAQIESEAKFTVTDIMGNVLIDNVPQSMIVPVAGPDDDASEAFRQAYEDAELIGHAQDARDALDTPKVKIIMPGSAEALGITLSSDDSGLD
jgi:hypothetical protein